MKFRILEESSPKVLNIGPLEDRIIRDGMRGASSTLATFDKWSNTYPQIKPLLVSLHQLYHQLNPGFVNKVTAIDIYAHSLKKWAKRDNNINTLKSNITELEGHFNREISQVKHTDSKRNRIALKNTVLRYWTSNLDQLQLILEFRETVIKIINQL